MKPDFLVVGLGNIGKAYANTRHNVGWMALDALASSLRAGEWKATQKFLCDSAEVSVNSRIVLLVKPSTYMNRSGECVRKLLDFYKLDPATQLLVVVDDVDLPLGTHRFREKGGPGTHNGMKSIVETIGEGFPRFRIGIGPQPEDADLAAWVLSTFTKEEQKALVPSYDGLLACVQQKSA